LLILQKLQRKPKPFVPGIERDNKKKQQLVRSSCLLCPSPKLTFSLSPSQDAAKAAVVNQRSKAKQDRKDGEALAEAYIASRAKGEPPVAGGKKRVMFA
jgi:hypothetical protein